jgi:hypothetical protein
MNNRNLDGIKWYQNNKGYWKNRKFGFQHVYVYEKLTGDKVCDFECIHHLDGNKSNNTAKNLVCMTRSDHTMFHNLGNKNWLGKLHTNETKAKMSNSNHQRGLRKDNSSGYKGVSFDKSANKYQALILINNKRKHLGRFDTLEQAALAYNQAAQKYYGDEAYQNII